MMARSRPIRRRQCDAVHIRTTWLPPGCPSIAAPLHAEVCFSHHEGEAPLQS
jgi:hypothetical protein